MMRYPYSPPGLVTFESHRRKVRRPTSSEMRDPLPPTLYKVLPRNFADSLIESGEMMWSTLTYFQNELDSTRGDPHEGSHRYFPLNGLQITREERNGVPDYEQFTRAGHGVQIKAFKCHHIFIYSTTLDPNLAIGDSEGRTSVEIFDTEHFFQHIEHAIATHRKARIDRLIHGEVRYWSPDNPPGAISAFPHLLTLHKHESHKNDS